MSGDKIKLKSDDWSALFPETPFTIGTTTLHLIPLSLSRLSRIITRLNLVGDQLAALNVDVGQLSSKDAKSMLAILLVILEHAPSVLTELSGVSEEDLQMLSQFLIHLRCSRFHQLSFEDYNINFDLRFHNTPD